jgi:hypothetical protein
MNKYLNFKMAHETIMLVSDTKRFIKKRAKEDGNLVPSLLCYAFAQVLSVVLISAVLGERGSELESKLHFVLMNYIFVPFLALAVLASWVVVGIKHSFYQDTLAMFYIHSVTTLLTSIGLMLYLSYAIEVTVISATALWSLLAILVLWSLRSWRAIAGLKRHTRKQLILSFVVFQLIYTPITIMFWSISGVMGDAL